MPLDDGDRFARRTKFFDRAPSVDRRNRLFRSHWTRLHVERLEQRHLLAVLPFSVDLPDRASEGIAIVITGSYEDRNGSAPETLNVDFDGDLAIDGSYTVNDGHFVVTYLYPAVHAAGTSHAYTLHFELHTPFLGGDEYATKSIVVDAANSAGTGHAGDFLLASAGSETKVNTYTTNSQDLPVVAMDADGNYVVVWASDGQDGSSQGIYFQRFNRDGTAQGPETRATTTTSGSQTDPSVAMDADGDFIIVWTGSGQDGGGDGIYAQRFNTAGVAQGIEFRVNSTTAGHQRFSSVAMDVEGNIVIAWASDQQDGASFGIYAQRFDADGVALDSEFRVNTTTADSQTSPSIAMDAAGNFVIAWQSNNQDGGSWGVYFQRFNNSGSAQGTETRANTFTTGAQTAPSISMSLGGRYVIAWTSTNQIGASDEVYAQLYNDTGSTVGGEFRANTYTTQSQGASSVSMDAAGNFVIVWESNLQDLSSRGVYGQRYLITGATTGSEFIVNTTTSNYQGIPSVAMNATGSFSVAWRSDNQDGSGGGIYSQRYQESSDTAGPFIAGVFTADASGNPTDRIHDGDSFTTTVSKLLVTFSENMATSGPGNITSTNNWQLSQDAVDLTAEITGITFGFNATRHRYEAIVSLAAPLSGNVTLGVKASALDANGNALDGNLDGTAGGAFSRSFSFESAESISAAATNANEASPVTLTGSFTDSDSGAHVLAIDWDNDGNYDESQTLSASVTSFTATHTYNDDGNSPGNGTATDVETIAVRLTNTTSGTLSTNVSATISNVAPSALSLSIGNVNENGTATLTGSFTDPGTQDVHVLVINWGEGSPQTVTLATGTRAFSVTHQYLDDNPTGDPSNLYTVNVTLNDDDTGSTSGSTSLTVSNANPVISSASITNANEGSPVTLTGSYSDVGTADTHSLTINWADGTTQTLAVSGGTFSFNHTYVDDNPTTTSSDPYAVTLTLTDDDSGTAAASRTTTISNVAPSALSLSIGNVNENGTATLTGSFTDPGTQDVHVLVINWGEGSPQTVTLATGTRAFSVTHQYLDDNPTGDSSNLYTVNVTLNDDDTGSTSGSTSLTVSNVNPSINSIGANSVNEAGTVTLTGTYSDVGTQDTHTLRINWADGSATQTVAVSAGAFTVTHVYADDGTSPGNNTASDVYTITAVLVDDDTGTNTSSTTTTISNVAPSALALSAGNVNENGLTTLTGSFTDPGTQDVHILRINWADGSATQTVTLATGTRAFSVTHQYLDDNPTNTSSDPYTITASVSDDDTASVTNSTSITVSNVNPSINSMGVSNANEAGTVTLSGTYSDVGTQDTHSLTINWADGTTQTLAVSGGAFTFTHVYADDGTSPGNGTASDIYGVVATLTDDDTGTATATRSTTISNVAPSALALSAGNISENGTTTLTGSFTDPGTQDVHILRINWADGSATQTITLATGTRAFSVTHQYLDDNPTNTSSDPYTITASVSDDDTASVTNSTSITVSNVNPVINSIGANSVNEAGTVTLTGTYSDVGTQDTHTLRINWADGSATQTVAVSAGAFTVTHVYADDGTSPGNNTASDIYTISATLVDDDTGTNTSSTTTTISNVAPSALSLSAGNINENGVTTLTGSFTDPGTQDVHILRINWADGSATQTVTLATGTRAFSVTHQYLDDGPAPGNNTASDVYTITASISDDDTASVTNSTSITVSNVAPSGLTLNAPTLTPQNNGAGSTITLTNTFTDPGTQDVHTLLINWGDGNPTQTVTVTPTGTRTQTVTHFYADPNPADNTTGVQYTISVTLNDDDTGTTSQTRTIWVDDPPKILDVTMRYGTSQSQTYDINTQLSSGTTGRTLPWVNVRAVDVLFSEDVSPSLGTGDAVLSLIAGTSPIPTMSSVTWNPGGTPANTARWVFAADLSIGQWLITFDNNNATGDGNNGIFDNNNLYLAMQNTRYFNILPGDFDGDAYVTSYDLYWVDYYRKGGTGYSPPFPVKYADLNGDGVVNINLSNPNDLNTDYGIVRKWLTKHLP